MKQDLEYASENDEFFDYCHDKYQSLTEYTGKLRSVNMLFHSFELMNCDDNFYDLVKLIQENLGSNKTVWGIKKMDDDIFWEFYFYNYEKKDPKIRISNILDITKPFFFLDAKLNENIPYFMFSIDIKPEFFENKKLNGIHIYTKGQNKRTGGLSFFLDENSIRLENHYAFYDPRTEMEEIISRIKLSMFIDFDKININEILLPELADCKRICIANKQENDCIYYSGIDINQFLFFLKRFEYPKEIISFIEINKSKLDHLQYDIGFDYKMVNDKLKTVKSGYYGTF